MTMVAGGALQVVAGMTCDGRMGRAKLDAGAGSDFIEIRTGLTSIASSSGVSALV